jgi:hypothetical protein
MVFLVHIQITLKISSAFDVTEIHILQSMQELNERPVDTFRNIRTTSFKVSSSQSPSQESKTKPPPTNNDDGAEIPKSAAKHQHILETAPAYTFVCPWRDTVANQTCEWVQSTQDIISPSLIAIIRACRLNMNQE